MFTHSQEQLHKRDFIYAHLYMCTQLDFEVKFVQTMLHCIKKKKKRMALFTISIKFTHELSPKYFPAPASMILDMN